MMIEIITKKIEGLPVLEVVAKKYRTQKLPLIVFYHGWTGCKERVLTEGYELAKRGFRSYQMLSFMVKDKADLLLDIAKNFGRS